MDNLGSHKSPAVRAAIRKAGAKLFFLPPYSPDLNPIEQVFAKLKHLLAQGRRAHRRGHLAKNRHTARQVHPERMPTTSSTQAMLPIKVIPL